MEKTILEKINEKLSDSMDDRNNVEQIINVMGISDYRDFKLGLLIGRLYNSFHYQTRRVLKRDPTQKEFLEFLDFLKSKKDVI